METSITATNLTTKEALTRLQQCLKQLNETNNKTIVQIIADCLVQYEGRAASSLKRGERLLVLKPDGTLLIHTNSSAKPVNWQPPGATFQVAKEDNKVVLTATRKITKAKQEIVSITFHKIKLYTAVEMADDAELELTGSEDDIQNLLYQKPELVESGFKPTRRERHTKRGYYDLDGRDAKGKRLIVEVKRGTAGIKDAQQLWRYVEELRAEHPETRGILIAKKIAPKALQLCKSHNLQTREIAWEDQLLAIQSLKQAGQSSLQKWH